MAISLPPLVADILKVAAPTLLAGLSLTGPVGVAVAGVASLALKAWLPPEKQAEIALNGGQASQADVVRVIQENAGNAPFLRDLKRAELDAQQLEADLGFRFAELEQKDRSEARAMARDTGMARTQFIAGMAVLVMAYGTLFAVVAGCIFAVTGRLPIAPGTENLTIAAFGLIGTVVGFINGYAGSIINFYWGSSKSSSDKSDEISATMRELGGALGDAAKAAPVRPPAPVVVAPPVAPPDVDDGGPGAPQPQPSQPAVPAPSGLVAELLPQLTKPHKHFEDGVWWALTPAGITVEGAMPQGTPGEPATCRAVWKRYGALFSAAAREYGVPVELLVATCLTESRGNPSARRAEPKINDASTGLMQTLRATARQALGRRNLTDDDLLDPATSINAGAAYIAQQRTVTHFDPPMVAAAYNAGSIRRDSGPANRWKMLCYPTGTGKHIDSFVAWMGDCMRVSAEQGWGQQEGVPSFATCLAAAAQQQREAES